MSETENATPDETVEDATLDTISGGAAPPHTGPVPTYPEEIERVAKGVGL